MCLSNILDHPPPPPVVLDDFADLTVEKAVGKGDDESLEVIAICDTKKQDDDDYLERQKNIPGEDEDCR